MDVRIPEKHHAPVVRLTDEERDWAQLTLPPRAVLLNTNCQTCCTVKGYPWWGEVVRIVARNGYAPVLTGGTEERDLRLDFGSLPGETVDMRGKTTLRQLVAMATAAVCAASPSSSLVHACAAAGCPCVVITGAREPTKVTDYPGNRHVFSVCTVGNMLYNQHQGCFMRHFGEIAQWPQYVCPRTMERRGRKYAACMACIPPEAVAEEILKTTAQKEASK